MKAAAEVLVDVMELSDSDKEYLLEALKRYLTPSIATHGALINELREKKYKEGFVCPACNSKSVIRYGKRDGRQRYRCKDCNKLSSDLTNTPLYRTKKADKWLLFIECMINGLSLRKAAKIVKVSHVTLFYWRHKILSAIKNMQLDKF
ncbi:transposase [Peribacillus sp. B-H-3]|uniref:transposase n=1 Tax=Peribacillus sp. B-H-3 TaxID=3400420 RepID=UPI003B01812D